MKKKNPAGHIAFKVSEGTAAKWWMSMPNWWDDHFTQAPKQIIEFFQGDGIALDGKVILDVGCGDGILSLGLSDKSSASKIIGVDLVEVDRAELGHIASANGVPSLPEPSSLDFIVSTPDHIPLADESIDAVVSWSVFEHVKDLDALWSEIRRVLKPDGLIFLQIWPMFWSEHGSHLWPWMVDSFIQYHSNNDEIKHKIKQAIPDRMLQGSVSDLYDSCNRITIDELQESMLRAGLYIAKVELITEGFHIDPGNQAVPLSKQGISGIKLLAVSH